MREENIRQTGWAAVIACGLVALFEVVWGVIGIAAFLGWSPLLPPGVRYTEFMLNIAAWTVVMVLLAGVSWRAAHGHLRSMWLMFVCSILLTGFTASVLFGLSVYDFGGALSAPIVRVVLYMLFTPVALFFVPASALALATRYRLRGWARPVIDGTNLM
jgi:hypothetical protein